MTMSRKLTLSLLTLIISSMGTVLSVDTPARTFEGHSRVIALSFSRDGSKLASGSRTDENAMIWNLTQSSERGRVLLKHFAPVASVDFSPDGSKLVTGSLDGTAIIWDVKTGTPVGFIDLMNIHEVLVKASVKYQYLDLGDANDRVSSVNFSPDGSRLLVATARSTGSDVMIYNVSEILKKKSISIHDISMVNPNAKQIGRTITNFRKTADDSFIAANFSPDGKRVVTGDLVGTAQVWDATNPSTIPLLTLKHSGGFFSKAPAVMSVKYSPNGALIATSATDKNIRIWDAKTGKTLNTIKLSDVAIEVSFNPNGTMLAAGVGNTIKIWNVTDAKLIKTIDTGSMVSAVRFSPDGRTIAAGFEHGIKIWSAQ